MHVIIKKQQQQKKKGLMHVSHTFSGQNNGALGLANNRQKGRPKGLMGQADWKTSFHYLAARI